MSMTMMFIHDLKQWRRKILRYYKIRYDTIRYDTMQYDIIIRHHAIKWFDSYSKRFSTIQCNMLRCKSMQCNAMQCNAMQCNAMQCNAMQFNAMQCSTTYIVFFNAMQCNVLECIVFQLNAILHEFPLQEIDWQIQFVLRDVSNDVISIE